MKQTRFFALILFLLSLIYSTDFATAQSSKNPVAQSAQNFTILMIVSFVIILGLWALVWFRRKKQ